MGPVERELRAASEAYRCGTGTNGTPYEFWAGMAGWAASEGALRCLSDAAAVCPDGEWVSLESWSEAIEAAEALGL